MRSEETGIVPGAGFARLRTQTYSTIPEALTREMVQRQVGRNGWAVMVDLCRRIYADGALGRQSFGVISGHTGLDRGQVGHGMQELREKGLIVPVLHEAYDGRYVPDRSCFGHVAQYCITRDVWNSVELDVTAKP